MANLSSAYGQMVLTGEWTDELICALDRFAQNVWSEWCYDITPGEFSPDMTCVDFYANGRYSLQYSLKTLGECSLEDSKDEKVISRYPQAADDHSILISGMEARGLGIGLNFMDEESGCEVLYAQQGVITAKDGQFTYTIIENTDYDFTWQNIFDLLDTGDEDFSNCAVNPLPLGMGIQGALHGVKKLSQKKISHFAPKTSFSRQSLT